MGDVCCFTSWLYSLGILLVMGKPTAVALFVLFHCQSQLRRIVGFRRFVTLARNAACCLEYLVLTVRI